MQKTEYETIQSQDIIDIPTSSPAFERNAIRESGVMYGGLAGMGLIMIQPFLGSGEALGLAAQICVLSFALSVPLLAALLLLNYEETFRKRMSNSLIAEITKSIALFTATVGFVAGLWHISPLAGQVAIASCVLALSAHSAGYSRLYLVKAKLKSKGQSRKP